jgi:hypothetical protein
MTRWHRVGLKVVLLGGTIVSLLSYGGLMIFTFPILAPGFWWAVRHSGLFERIAWIVVAAPAAALWAWEITYPVTDGKGSSSIIAAVAAAIAASLLALVATQYSFVRKPATRAGRSESRDESAATL